MDTIIDDLSHRLAHRLRLERDSRGWSLADLAERSGVSKATISKIERPEVRPTAVVRDKRFAVPRLDMKPAPPPMPRPPPSDFCSSTVAISTATIMR